MENYKFYHIAPLVNFDSTVDIIQLDENIQIRRLNDNEHELFNNLSKKWTTVSSGEFCIDCRLIQNKPASKIHQYRDEAEKVFNRIISILRLFREENVGYNLIVEYLSEERTAYSASHRSYQRLWKIFGSRYFKKKYKIEQSKKSELQKFYNDFPKDSISELELPLEWFNKSYNEPYIPRDGIIDLLIALENLFIGDRRELGYKLRTRMALFLGNDFKQRKQIYNNVKEAYNFRGAVLHGSKPKPIDLELFLKIRHYTRLGLMEFLKSPEYRQAKKKDEILDDIILSGGREVSDNA